MLIPSLRKQCRTNEHKIADRKLQLFFRKLQVMHVSMVETFRTYVAVCYYSVLALTISMTFSFIRHRSTMNPFTLVMLASVDLTILLMSFIAFSFWVKMSESSKNYCGSFKVRNKGVDEAFLRSCRPIDINVGGLFTVSSKNFCLETFGNVILKNIIDLLLTF